jgi:hypothetical protein
MRKAEKFVYRPVNQAAVRLYFSITFGELFIGLSMQPISEDKSYEDGVRFTARIAQTEKTFRESRAASDKFIEHFELHGNILKFVE